MRPITRRDYLKKTATGGLAIALSGITGLSESNCSKQKPPNLIYVFPDQMCGQAVGFLGEEPVITPNLDRFATEGVVFTQAVSNYPLCSPYRGMLMTGQYPITNGVLNNCHSESAVFGIELKQSSRCWSDILHEKGYSLGYIGKWHLDAPHRPYVKCYNNNNKFAWNEWCPPERRHGFDFWYAYGTYDVHLHPMYWDTNEKRDEAHWVDQWGPEHEADKAIKYIKNEGGNFRNPNRPFALVVSMNPPHMPYDQVPEKYVRYYDDVDVQSLCRQPNIPPAGTKWGDYYRNNIKNYYAMITGVDEQFNRILEALKEAGLEKDTIVVFTSDHGNCLGIHNEISKDNHYEESMRVPFIIRWAGKITPRRDDLLFSSPDIYPTLLDLMGFANDIPPEVEGKSRAKLLLTGKGDRPTSQLYLRIPLGKPAFGRRGIRNYQYTLMISNMPDQELEIVLYDRMADPYELKNIAMNAPHIVTELIKNELQPWLEYTKDPWWNNTKNKLKAKN